jgi:opacity protein-like surface antigen
MTKRANLLAFSAVATMLTTSNVLAQEASTSVGPTIQFSEGGTSFGIQGKIGVGSQFSVRPMILFGYKPLVTKSDITKGLLKGGTSQADINTPVGQALVDTLSKSVGTGTAYGLSVTYDFQSPDSKIVGYVGPRVLFASASGSGDFGGTPFTTNTTETNIGLTAGADYAISDNLTAGLNATYNFSRTGTTSATFGGITPSTPISGGSFNFGVSVGYNF